ncbi:MAG: hypothetical protein IPI24_07935 [Ignavibacteria bacterium]|nr:hypothetical protein [Ignavibacteria bacterium]
MACQRASDYGSFGYGAIRNIIERGLDLAGADESAPGSIPDHDNIRGGAHYDDQHPDDQNPDNTINPEEQP